MCVCLRYQSAILLGSIDHSEALSRNFFFFLFFALVALVAAREVICFTILVFWALVLWPPQIADMRRRWQDATSRSEEIAADVHESTTPLLRQIRALQEDGRARAQAWASAEASFMERSAVAEDDARAAEQARSSAEERATAVDLARRAAEASLRDAKSALAVAAADGRAATARATSAEDRTAEAEADLEAAREQQRRAARELRTAEAKAKMDRAEAAEAAEAAAAEAEKLQARLAASEARVEELQAAAAAAAATAAITAGDRRNPHGMLSPLSSPIHATPTRGENGTLMETPTMLNMSLLSNAPNLHPIRNQDEMFGNIGLQPGHQPMQNGGATAGGGGVGFVVQLEKLHLTVKQREGEALAARERLRQAEEVRDALTHEVAQLGHRNNELEVLAVEAPKLRKVPAIPKKSPHFFFFSVLLFFSKKVKLSTLMSVWTSIRMLLANFFLVIPCFLCVVERKSEEEKPRAAGASRRKNGRDGGLTGRFD